MEVVGAGIAQSYGYFGYGQPVLAQKFGGGGHLNTAGAQVEMSPEEILIRIREALNEKNS